MASSVRFEVDKCIASDHGLTITVIPPRSNSTLPEVEAVINNRRIITGTYLQVRDSIFFEGNDTLRRRYNNLLRRCWAHPAIMLWKNWMPVIEATKNPPLLRINVGKSFF